MKRILRCNADVTHSLSWLGNWGVYVLLLSCSHDFVVFDQQRASSKAWELARACCDWMQYD